jgi:U4/U6 small nuclear ribonucleoprotein PRP31
MEATTTLADALLDDLDDLMDSDEEAEQVPEELASNEAANVQVEDTDDGPDVAVGGTTMEIPVSSSSSAVAITSGPLSSSRSSFLGNPTLNKHLNTIRNRNGKPSPSKSQKEMEEEDHQLVVQSNKHLANMSEELARAHAELAMAYRPKFPELEELVPNYIQYKNAVRTIWNEMDLTKVNDDLGEILSSNQIITLSVAGSTTSGRILTEAELRRLDAAANYMEQLLEVQGDLVTFVENSMEALAPSICALIGPRTAARLLGLAGGLAELTKIPSCNLQVMGQVKQNSASRAGLSGASTKQHVGILADCELVQSVPKQLQKKALKAVAAKLALAARYDFVNVDAGRSRSAQTGRHFRAELMEKFEKLLEPDKAPVLKALPK